MPGQDPQYIGQSNRAATTERFARHVSAGKVDFFRAAGIDLVMGRREGPFIWDVTGEPLTDRELEVLRLVAIGQSNEAIAEALVISIETVKKHLKNIYGKLDVHSRLEAVHRAREAGCL